MQELCLEERDTKLYIGYGITKMIKAFVGVVQKGKDDEFKLSKSRDQLKASNKKLESTWVKSKLKFT